MRLLQRPQVDRDRGADGETARGLAALLEVAAQGARRGGDEHVVDGRAESLADGLEVIQRHRPRPRRPLAPSELAFECRGGVRRQQHQAAESIRAGCAESCKVGQVARIVQKLLAGGNAAADRRRQPVERTRIVLMVHSPA